MALPFSRGARWLFIGDSITDCGRRDCPEALGSGYPRLVRDWLRSLDAANAPEILNTGISGNKVTDLEARWDADVLAHRPALVSIQIGINDVWHGLEGNDNGVPIEKFRETYAAILTRLQSALPGATLVLCEPGVIWPPAPGEGNAALQPYVAAVRELGGKFQAHTVVPLHAAFEKAKAARPDIEWAPDGVHPSSSGHMLIARTWLGSLGLL